MSRSTPGRRAPFCLPSRNQSAPTLALPDDVGGAFRAGAACGAGGRTHTAARCLVGAAIPAGVAVRAGAALRAGVALVVGAAIVLAGSSAGAAFLEPDVEVLYATFGEAAGDTYGFVVEPIGDLDGDGVSEFVTSAPYHRVAGLAVGKVYLHDGANGGVLRVHTGSVPAGRFGFRLSTAGDFDADGTPDYAIGAPGDEGSSIDGAVFVYSGDLALAGEDALLFAKASEVTAARLGRGLGCAGDIDGDGHDDLLVGAPREDRGATDSGAVYVFSGRTSEVLRVHEGSGTQMRLGQACFGMADVSGDGLGDYLIGAPGGGAALDGVVWVVDGASGATVRTLEPDAPTAQEFGGFFANSPGDVTGDSVDDIFVGDYNDNAHGPTTGRTYLFDGASGAKLGYEVSGDSAGDWNGFGGRQLGDLDEDGRMDFVTNFFDNDGTPAPTGGRVVVYSGATGAALRTITSLEGTANGSYGEWLGYDVTGIGDVNGDTVPDLLVSAGLNGEVATSAGKVYVIAGRSAESASLPEGGSDGGPAGGASGGSDGGVGGDADGPDGAPGGWGGGSAGAGRLTLLPASPNPFREQVAITYRIATESVVTVAVHDASGRVVARLDPGRQRAGRHTVHWDGTAPGQGGCCAGVYYVAVRAGEDIAVVPVVRVE